jgi:hypothetical protein
MWWKYNVNSTIHRTLWKLERAYKEKVSARIQKWYVCPCNMFLYKFSSDCGKSNPRLYCCLHSTVMCWFKPSITIVLMNCQISWQSVAYLGAPWDLVWEAKCRIRKVCHFQMSSGTTEERFWFLKGTHVLQSATHWVRPKPFPVKDEFPTIWCPQNTTILDVLRESAIHAELI